MTDEQTVSPRDRVIDGGYLPALWLAPAERFLPPGSPPRTVESRGGARRDRRGRGNAVTWELRIPHRDRDEPLDARTIWELPKLLDSDEDARVTRELLALVCVSGAKTVGQVVDVVESLDAADRRLFIDACRKSAGLRTATEIDDRRAYELANAAGRARGNPLLQRCHDQGCDRVPITEAGSLREVKARRWFCPEHAHLAQPGDLEDRPPPWRYSPSGAIVEVDEADGAREAERAESRRRAREAQAADRAVEAEERRKHQEAVAAEHRRLVPPGVPA